MHPTTADDLAAFTAHRTRANRAAQHRHDARRHDDPAPIPAAVTVPALVVTTALTPHGWGYTVAGASGCVIATGAGWLTRGEALAVGQAMAGRMA